MCSEIEEKHSHISYLYFLQLIIAWLTLSLSHTHTHLYMFMYLLQVLCNLLDCIFLRFCALPRTNPHCPSEVLIHLFAISLLMCALSSWSPKLDNIFLSAVSLLCHPVHPYFIFSPGLLQQPLELALLLIAFSFYFSYCFQNNISILKF